MRVITHDDKMSLGLAAALEGASAIRETLKHKGSAAIIVATGASQFEMIEQLIKQDIDWSKVTAFHLDEYVGLAQTHPASFRKYLQERFVQQVEGLKSFVPVIGDADDIQAELERLRGLISKEEIDVCFAGIGENCHLAFNDPPADFETTDPYLVVNLDEACRRQQMGEGWFPTFEDVPTQAISMGIRQIMAARHIILSVPDARKADAAKAAVEGPVSHMFPASILQNHPKTTLHLDRFSAASLSSV